jgi:hypothetical protein
MANPNFSLHCPCLTKDNYEIWCIHVKAWLGSQDMCEMIENGFEESMEGVTLTSIQREVV